MKLYITINRNAKMTFTQIGEESESERIFASPQAAMNFADHALTYGGIIYPSEWTAEPILLRVLRRVREGTVKCEDIILTVEDEVIAVTADGDLARPFPGGFYHWRADELF